MGRPHRAHDESATLSEAHARVGGTLNDKWKLERLLGVGGMGAVYSGLHRNGARAAVKVLHHTLAQHDDVRTRFLREGYAANRVEHPSVVKVLDDDIVVGGPDDGTAYLVMELLVGESLETRRHRGLAISEHDFLLVADVVLEALDVAHRGGVVHRDIKPDNIFITRGGVGRDRVRVLDFGLARLLEGRSMTVHGVALGTPPFMSPEQAAGRNDEIDGRTDLFALAATGFRLVTGQRIHEGASSVELVLKMGKLPAPRIRSVAPQVSVALAHVLDRALEFRREDRYESAAAMRADVESALAVVHMGLQGTRPPGDARRDESIELSASDFEAMSLELSASDLEPIVSLELSAGALEHSKSVELRTRELEALEPKASTQPAPVVEPLPPTQEMLASDPGVVPADVQPAEAAPHPMPQNVAAAASATRLPRHYLVGAAVGLGVVSAIAALAVAWLTASAPASLYTPSASTFTGPSATTHLSPPKPSPDKPTTKPGRRQKH